MKTLIKSILVSSLLVSSSYATLDVIDFEPDGIPNMIVFENSNSQSQFETEMTNFESQNITNYQDQIIISDTQITNLSGFDSITDLRNIQISNSNPNLTEISGFNNVTQAGYIGIHATTAPALESIGHLCNIANFYGAIDIQVELVNKCPLSSNICVYLQNNPAQNVGNSETNICGNSTALQIKKSDSKNQVIVFAYFDF